MRHLMNFIRGMVCVRLTGLFPERLINLCAQEVIDFWAIEWLDEHTVRFTTRRHTLGLLEELALRAGCEVVRESSRGLPDFLGRFRTRYAFLAGLIFALCAVSLLSRFVLTVEVTGNENVPTAVILSQLRQLGVRPGAYGPALPCKQLAQEALLQLKDLSWMAINLHGTRVEVIVREVIKQPERIDESGYYDVVAQADGVVTHLEPERGEALVQEGDVVAKGDVLISGTVSMEPPLYSDSPVVQYQTHARGRVWARTWRTLTAALPLETAVKDYTGKEKSVWSVNIFGKRIKIFGNTGIVWPMYDKMTVVRQARLPDGQTLPLFLSRETFRAYDTRTVQADQDAAQALLEEELQKRLTALIGEDGQVEEFQFSARVSGGRLEVTLTARCLEEIGEERPGEEQG
ncbi:sporulation protein YqfD [Colidextribacter sp. OB.20]|uniref:sporulation protein YqfD n=1 Tax=Colidextribacter sp. OB.20 TaxID=2304568 RepID=UPI00136EC021|nr:sporulation protein YqfD [Colidextribacter sp. OB.20]